MGILEEGIREQAEEEGKQTAEAPEPKEKEPGVVDLSPPDDDDPDEDDVAARKKPDKRSRAVGRIKELNSALNEERESRQMLERRLRDMEETVRRSADEVRRGAEPQQDPYEGQINDLWSQQQRLASMIVNAKDESEAKAMSDQWRQIADKRSELIAERAVHKNAPKYMPRQMDPQRMALEAEYADVYNHPGALNWAKGEHARLVEQERVPDDVNTAKRALMAAARAFRLRKEAAPPVSEAQKARYGAVPSQAGAVPGKRMVQLSPEQRRLAIARYGDQTGGDDQKAYDLWAKNVGIPSGLLGG